MAPAIDPQYQFTCLSNEGQRHTRSCYWEALYAFVYGPSRIIVATRVVPFNNVQEALYTAFQSPHGETLTQQLLPQATQHPILNLHKGHDAFVENILSLVPKLPSVIPDHILQKSEEIIEETISQELIRHGIAQGLSSFAQTDTDPYLAEKTSEDLSAIEQNNQNATTIRQSFQIDNAIKKQMRDTVQNNLSENALAHNNLEFNLACRLYSNPQYLAYVKHLIKTKGSYISPIVRDFLSFYTRCLNIRLCEIGRQDHTDPRILAKRIESILGHTRDRAPHYLNYHDLTILGTHIKGPLTPDPTDPDRTNNTCFKLSPQTETQTLLLQDITNNTQRYIIRKFVEHTFNIHHNIRNLRHIDEDENPPKPETPTPDPTHQTLVRLSQTFETYLNNNRDKVIHFALTGIVVVLTVTLWLFLSSVLKLSTP